MPLKRKTYTKRRSDPPNVLLCFSVSRVVPRTPTGWTIKFKIVSKVKMDDVEGKELLKNEDTAAQNGLNGQHGKSSAEEMEVLSSYSVSRSI